MKADVRSGRCHVTCGCASSGEKDENETSSIFRWDDGLHFTGPGARWKIKLGGAGEIDTTGFSRDEPLDTALGDLEGGVQWRRARLYAEGLFEERFEFKFQFQYGGHLPGTFAGRVLNERKEGR